MTSIRARRRCIALLMFGPLISLMLGIALHVAAGYVFDMYDMASPDGDTSTSQGMTSGIESSKGDVSFARNVTNVATRGLIYIGAILIVPCFAYGIVLHRRYRRDDPVQMRDDSSLRHDGYGDMLTKKDSNRP